MDDLQHRAIGFQPPADQAAFPRRQDFLRITAPVGEIDQGQRRVVAVHTSNPGWRFAAPFEVMEHDNLDGHHPVDPGGRQLLNRDALNCRYRQVEQQVDSPVDAEP